MTHDLQLRLSASLGGEVNPAWSPAKGCAEHEGALFSVNPKQPVHPPDDEREHVVVHGIARFEDHQSGGVFDHCRAFQRTSQDRLILGEGQPAMRPDISDPDRIRNLQPVLRSVPVVIDKRDALKRGRFDQVQRTGDTGAEARVEEQGQAAVLNLITAFASSIGKRRSSVMSSAE